MKRQPLWIWAAALALGVAGPAPARQREWARAGRILTGYVVLRTLVGDPLWPSTNPYYGRHSVVMMEPYPSVFTSHPHAYRYYPARTRTRSRRVPPGDPPERWDSRPAAERPAGTEAELEPLMVPLPDGRRLYQPASAGSPAYVQRWSQEEERWVSVAQMPSLR